MTKKIKKHEKLFSAIFLRPFNHFIGPPCSCLHRKDHENSIFSCGFPLGHLLHLLFPCEIVAGLRGKSIIFPVLSFLNNCYQRCCFFFLIKTSFNSSLRSRITKLDFRRRKLTLVVVDDQGEDESKARNKGSSGRSKGQQQQQKEHTFVFR